MRRNERSGCRAGSLPEGVAGGLRPEGPDDAGCMVAQAVQKVSAGVIPESGKGCASKLSFRWCCPCYLYARCQRGHRDHLPQAANPPTIRRRTAGVS